MDRELDERPVANVVLEMGWVELREEVGVEKAEERGVLVLEGDVKRFERNGVGGSVP